MGDGAHALSEADVLAIRGVFKAVVDAQNRADWDGVQRHLTSDHVGLDPRVEGPVRGIDAWRELVDSLGAADIDIEFVQPPPFEAFIKRPQGAQFIYRPDGAASGDGESRGRGISAIRALLAGLVKGQH